MSPKWLIYARVSSQKQVQEWNWLSSQGKRCSDYAKNTLWIEIERVFYDEWVSWWLFERKSIKELLKHIQDNKRNEYVVIFEDLNRLSRDIQVHHLIKKEIQKRGASLACVNFEFDDSPEWNFKENISVVVSSYEREKNRQRVIDRQKSRLEQWFWCFRVPTWLKYIKAPSGWKIIVHDEEYSNKIKYAFEKFAFWELETLSDLLIYMNQKWFQIGWMNKKWEVTSLSVIHRMVTNSLYAWYYQCHKWNIDFMKAQHKWIISLKTFNTIQNKLISKSQIERKVEWNVERKDISSDFPLRWFLYCEESKGMFSGWWTQWNTRKVPYYTFPRKSSMKWKSLNRNKFHKDFEVLLEQIQPNKDLLEAFEKAIEIVSSKNKEISAQNKKLWEKEIKKINEKIEWFIERIWNSNSEVLIWNYEKKVEELEAEKKQILQKSSIQLKNVWTPLKNKLKLAKNGLSIWKSSNLENKKKLLKNIFPHWIPINEKKQVWTPTFSLIYQSFAIGKSSKMSMVELDGFEPTSWEATDIHLLS